ncbi:MAG TPA: FAD-linked oxidase C-terminal domain-containing protein [Acidimicrobiales bacterium]|nr:FAD-linked oxidase C-terminal domain-containing protein [Acidimicrobiales bacterium]
MRIGRVRTRSGAKAAGDNGLHAALVAAIGADNVHASSIDTALYARDASVIDEGFTSVVCFPATTAEVQACVRAAVAHGQPFVARGSGTGLAGGAVPCGGAAVITTTRMDTIYEVDMASGVAWVGPGVLNLDVSRHLAPYGVHFAPDPSSQQSCSIGGNVANNSGGPHCLAYGVTSAHIVALEVVLPDGEITVLGGLDPEPAGFDLRGAFVGSEGTMGIATKIAVRLTPNPPTIRTMLIDFESVADAGATVSGIIAAGVVPAAIEMMDALTTRAVEDFVHAGYPTDAAAILLVEVDGLPGGVEHDLQTVTTVARANRARTIRIAADETERAALWKGRKSAFGAVARIKPNYYLHDTVIPRTRLVEVLEQVYAIARKYDLLVMNVFHAGDGNLHPLLVYDAREPGTTERVYAAGKEIVEASLAVGGVLSGEHGIGLEKRAFMHLQFSDDDLEHQAKLRRAFDPIGLANPGKVLPSGSSCGDVFALSPEQQQALRDGGAWL